jgi:hypothetical protein
MEIGGYPASDLLFETISARDVILESKGEGVRHYAKRVRQYIRHPC